ncbi:MAG: enoyl-CoA hydratase/isomerase family protein, partial [Deltaproteobacteria bacterium]|nr:enoyl-CoA hydratase/isomerase family protein [Deltaproteobacteria bacterium]
RELDHALKGIEADESLKVAVLTGAGDKAFIVGGDIKYMEKVSASTLLNEQTEGQNIIRGMEELRKPLIARINGVALGGGTEVALACDIRIASEKARFGLPEITLGIIPGYGGTQRLARLVGAGKAKELMMTGDIISAEEALRIGLVNRVVPHEQLDEEVDKLAKKLCERPPLGLQMVKETVNYGLQMDLNSAIRMEARVFNILLNSEDRKEGMSAFLEKRKPVFSGK